MKTIINNKQVDITKEELIQFCHDEYSTLSFNDLVDILVELDMNSSCFEEMWLEKFETYEDEDREIILAKIRKNQ